MADTRAIIWRKPALFETAVQVEVGSSVDIDLTVTMANGQTGSLAKHNSSWPSWLTLTLSTEHFEGAQRVLSASLTGTPPEGGAAYEALLRASDGANAADRTFRFSRAIPETAELEWVLPLEWMASDGTVVLPSVRQGDEYRVVLDSQGGRRAPIFVLAEVDTLEVGEDTVEGLPVGLTLNGATGVIEGVPEPVDQDTDYRFMVTLTDGTQSLPLVFSLTVSAASADVPHWYTPPGSLGVLLGGQTVEITLDARNAFGKIVEFTIVDGELPDDLTMDLYGLITGRAAPVSSLQSYTFTVRAQTVGDSEYRLRQFSVSVLSAAVKGVIEWITPEGHLGDLIEEQPSHLSVRAELKDQPELELHYVVGTEADPPALPLVNYQPRAVMPPGLSLFDCDNQGLIVGRPEVDTAGEYTIAVLVYSGEPDDPTHMSAIRTFGISIAEHYPSEHIELRCPLVGAERDAWRRWISQVPIEDNFLYRRCDWEFGKIINPTMYVVGGMRAEAADPYSDVLSWMGPHHDRFRVMLGSPEIATVRGEDRKVRYELIYLPVYGVSPEQDLSQTPPFPTSVSNLRREILNNAPDTVPEILPPWMQQQQIRRNGTTFIGFQAAFVAAYVKAGTARTIVSRWRQLGVYGALSGTIVEIDRYDVHVVRRGGLSQRDVRTALFAYEVAGGTGYNVVTEPPPSTNFRWTLTPQRGELLLLTGPGQFTIRANLPVEPQVGALTLVGQYSQPWQLLAPPAATLTLMGELADIDMVKHLSPAPLSLTITGTTPSSETTIVVSVAPVAAELDLLGQQSLLGLTIDIVPDFGSLLLATTTPSLGVSFNVEPAAASLTVSGELPIIETMNTVVPVTVDAAELSFALQDFTIDAANTHITITLARRNLLLIPTYPDVIYVAAVEPATAVLDIEAQPQTLVTLNTHVDIAPVLATITLNGETFVSDAFNGTVDLNPAAGLLSLTVGDKDVLTLNGTLITITMSSLLIDLTGETAALTVIDNTNITIVVDPVDLTLTAEMASVTTSDATIMTIEVPPTVITATGQQSALTVIDGTVVSLEPAWLDLFLFGTTPVAEGSDASIVSMSVDAANSTFDGQTPNLVVHIVRDVPLPLTTVTLEPLPFTIEALIIDPHWADVVLLMDFEGTDGSTTFTDESSLGHSVSPVGGSMISTSQQQVGSSSLRIDAPVVTEDEDYLDVAPSSAFILDADFTVELWIYSSIATEFYFSMTTGTAETGTVRVYTRRALGADVIEEPTVPIAGGTWTHVAIDRATDSLTTYVNGIVAETITVTTDQAAIEMGISVAEGDESWNGYIDYLRITSGVARYAGLNFTPEP